VLFRSLADYIEVHYHARAKALVPEIVKEIEAILNATPEDIRDAMVPLQHLRIMLTEDMEKHTREEEEVLFPYIRSLESGVTPDGTLGSIGRIHNEHDQIVDTLVRIKLKSTLCRLPESTCEYCRPLYDRLAVLLADLHEHAFLEDDILFPEALELEKERR